jgi:hypothetical protein
MAKNGKDNHDKELERTLVAPDDIRDLLQQFIAMQDRPAEPAHFDHTADARADVLIACNDAVKHLSQAVMHIATIANSAPNYKAVTIEDHGVRT